MNMTKVAPVAALAVFGASCAHDSTEHTELSVFAATSLTDAFGALEAAFEASNPDIDLVTTFAGSQVLRLQIEQGASAHVFASANEEHARSLADAGLATDPVPFAHNRLVLVVPRENPAGIASIEDLVRAERLVVGSAAVPIGRYTRTMLEQADHVLGAGFASDVRSRIVSEESNVRLVRAKVELGEADAAVVYRTDALASDRIRSIELPAEFEVSARYVIAKTQIAGGAVGAAADRFVEFARSDEARVILTRYGFDVDGV